jgi:hypothetical protein
VALESDAGKTTQELLDDWRKAESAIFETEEGSLARMFMAQQADEAREAYVARVAELADMTLDELADSKLAKTPSLAKPEKTPHG